MILLGMPLYPDERYLALTRRIAEEHVSFFEVSPEMLWQRGTEPGPQRAPVLEIVRRSGKPVVGHGLSLSLGSPIDARAERWLSRLAVEHRDFEFLWFSEHLGFTEHGGLNLDIPLPLAPTEETRRVVTRKLRALQAIFGTVAFENLAATFFLGDPAREPEFLSALAAESGASLVLDLHNAWTQCVNSGVELSRWLDAIDATRVIEIHLAGGSVSDPRWLRSGKTMRLDSHDGAVPEEVWRGLERMIRRCSNLRGVTIERVPASISAESVKELEREFTRAREILCSTR